MIALQMGKFSEAEDLCSRVNEAEQETCFLQLFDRAITLKKLDDAEYLCRTYIHNDPGQCWLTLGDVWSEVDTMKAVAMCLMLDPNGARYFTCIESTALILRDRDEAAAMRLCDLLDTVRSNFCKQDLLHR